jgi:hypothetical protein
MTLNSSGPISLAGTTAGVSIEIENGGNGTTQISLNDTAVRNLAGVPSGAITMPTNFYGKSNRAVISSTFTSNTANASLNVSAIGGYSAGTSDITVTINSGVYLYATSTGNYGLNLSGGTTGDTITVVNSGFIMGQGGRGADGPNATNAFAGGPAFNVGTGIGITINNGSGYIGGGGGGGGTAYTGGGGGAGGGTGGRNQPSTGGAGGGPGSSGSNGNRCTVCICGTRYMGTGAGGGRIMPGSGGAGGTSGGCSNTVGKGSGAGGGGGAVDVYGYGGAGGGAGSAGSAPGCPGAGNLGGAGGGGYGASGGSSTNTCYGTRTGAAGGKAINKNGKTVTFSSGCGRVYGAVS